jgi:NAD+ synthase (glutamine-hydrolysing)
MMDDLRVALGQLPVAVGDIAGNTARIEEVMAWAERERADVLVLPELVLTGYPVADLVLHREFVAEVEESTRHLAAVSGRTTTILGTIARIPPRRSWDTIDRFVSIAAAVLNRGEHRGTYHKVLLPTHGAFDEGRNLGPGLVPNALWQIGDVVAGISICEDLWSGDGPPEAQSRGGARILLAGNASPYHRSKREGREHLASQVARRNGVPLVYVNLVGGQDDIVFDGASLVVDADGTLLHRAAAFAEDRAVLDVPLPPARPVTGPVHTVHTVPIRAQGRRQIPRIVEADDDLTNVWNALRLGTRDFATKNGFERAVLGLSGGIDAAMTATLAADVFGPGDVLGIAMPGPGTPADELEDAQAVARSLGIGFAVVPLAPLITGTREALTSAMGDARHATAAVLDAEPRVPLLRAGLLRTISDAHGHLLLATANKTELSIGAATLRSDAVGDFAPLRDCSKTLLYRLARHPGAGQGRIPDCIVAKSTTAQDRENEKAPSYIVLDMIVQRYVQYGEGVEDLVARGLDPEVVLDVLHRIDTAEFARRQTPPGVTLNPRAFGTDRRMPITNAWRPKRRSDSGIVDPDQPRFPLDPETALDLDR